MARYDASKSVAVCTAGTAIEDMSIRIIDEQGREIKEQGITGEIAIRGGSVAMGYVWGGEQLICLLYTSPSPRDRQKYRMPSSA